LTAEADRRLGERKMVRVRQQNRPDEELDTEELDDDETEDLGDDAEFEEEGDEMPSTKATKKAGKASPNAGRPYDDEGWALNKRGERDIRWKSPVYNPETGERLAPSASNGNTATKTATKTRAEKVAEVFGDDPKARGWKYVEDGIDPNGTKSALGANLKQWYKIEDKDGNQLTVGRGEMEKFALVSPPKKERAARQQSDADAAEDDFSEAFEEEEEDELLKD
jgi:hypothetical protein